MKIFGDDGFRDIVNRGLLKPSFLKIFFCSLNKFFKKRKIKKIVIGYDTRETKNYILKIIFKELLCLNYIEIIKVPISTPGLQYISQQKSLFAIMITASHFPNHYNGFKFFYKGVKLSKKIEKSILKEIDTKKKISKYDIKLDNIKKNPKIIKKSGFEYFKFINNTFKFQLRKKILIDCSFGSVSGFYKKINFFKNLRVINYLYKQNKINHKSGSNFLKKNLKNKKYRKNDFCIAFDGDADRVTISEKNYGLIEPEKLAVIFANFFDSHRKVKSIVSTEISNPWIREKLEKKKIKLYLSKVGDRNVINLKKKKNSFFGFETSGHFCLYDHMDGIYTAGVFLKILNSNSSIIYNVLKDKLSYKKIIYGLKKKEINNVKYFLKKNKNNNLIYKIRKSIWIDFFKLYIFYKKKDKNYNNTIKFLANKIIKKKFEN